MRRSFVHYTNQMSSSHIRFRHATAGRLVAGIALATVAGAATLPAQTPASATTTAGVVVSGVVYDSIARQRIPGVTVQLVNADNPGAGRPFVAVSDSSGRYTISGVPAGRYIAGFFHPALDTLGIEVPPRQVEIGSAAVRVDLATPSGRTVVRTVCASASPDSAGLFMGTVRGTQTESAIEGATVVVEWSEFVFDVTRLYERPRTATVKTTPSGWFAFCGLPTDVVLLSRAMNRPDTSGFIEVQVPANGLRYQNFLIGGASTVRIPNDTVAAPSGASRPVSRTGLVGGARLSGTVLDTAGRPIANAHALLWGTNFDVQTNDRGAFVLEGLPGGTHTLEIRVIGFIPVTRVVQLAESRPVTVEVKLNRAAVILATETIRGTLVYSRNLVEFDRRRRSGFGRYMTAEDLERRPNTRLSFFLQGMAGIYVQPEGGRNQVLMRAGAQDYCTPTLYVDGNRDLSGDFDYLYTDELAGIEVYPRESTRPGGYTDFNGCGAVLVWTRPRPMKVKKDQ